VRDLVISQRPADDPALGRLTAEVVPGLEAAGERLAASGEPGDVVFVAELRGHPAGYLAARVAGDALVLDRLVVAPADQGQHVGHALLDWAEGYTASRSLRRVAVPADGADERARAFYASRGYILRAGQLTRAVPYVD
jgi:GNAT superfamily N-acetyltransferase